MNAAKAATALKSMTSVAQKVYEAVPVQEHWSAGQIRNEAMRLHGTAPDLHVLQGCLGALENADLVRKTGQGTYIRTPVRQPVIALKEPVQASPQPAQSAPAPAQAAANEPAMPVEPMVALAEMSQRLRLKAADLIAMADELDEMALSVEEGIEKMKSDSSTLRQLQTLLKSLG